MLHQKITTTIKSYISGKLQSFARKEDINNAYNQLAALLQIERLIHQNTTYLPLREWAISPDAILIILQELSYYSDPIVLEFGSGQSTLIMASYLKKRGCGKILTVESNKMYADLLMKNLKHQNLHDVVDMQVLNLKNVLDAENNNSSATYDLQALKTSNKYDVCIIDGPPLQYGALARYYPLEYAINNSSHGGKIFLDDSKRENERNIIDKIRSKYRNIKVSELKAEKGLTMFNV